jgi:hypothetical protein
VPPVCQDLTDAVIGESDLNGLLLENQPLAFIDVFHLDPYSVGTRFR